MRKLNTGLKGQDILILCYLIVVADRSTQQLEISRDTNISTAEVSFAIKRLQLVGLISRDKDYILERCIEFFVHAFKYFFPPEYTQKTRGMATSYSHDDFKFVNKSGSEILVWPYAEGENIGTGLVPFYKTIPSTCLNYSDLYKFISLIEVFRSGRVREISFAKKEIISIVNSREKSQFNEKQSS